MLSAVFANMMRDDVGANMMRDDVGAKMMMLSDVGAAGVADGKNAAATTTID